MKTLAHLSDAVLRRELIAAVARDRITTAELLAHIAEFDARKLYVPEGYSSMHAYCVEELHLSEDAAAKRIQAARAARRFPDLLSALAEGSLHLSGVWLLAPHLTPENVNDLIESATHRRKAEIEQLLAGRFPRPDLKATVRPLGVAGTGRVQHAPGHVEGGDAESMALTLDTQGSEPSARTDQHAPGHVERSGDQGVLPSPERFLVQVTINKSTHEKLRYAQALLSHVVPGNDVAQVLDRALDALIETIERRKLGADPRRRSVTHVAKKTRRGPVAAKGRYIPAQVRRAVWERDEGRCTFESKSGHRCGERRFLQFDHAEPVARGGEATVAGIRLRCRAHNQYEAERVFGSEFMRQKREEARNTADGARKRAEARAHAEKEQKTQILAREQAKDVLAGLRGLGCRADQAKRAAQFVETLPCATLEERMRAALGFINRASARYSANPGT